MFKNLKSKIETAESAGVPRRGDSTGFTHSASSPSISNRAKISKETDYIHEINNSVESCSRPFTASLYSNSNGSTTPMQSQSSLVDYESQYKTLEATYQQFRENTNDLLAKKDSHIERLKARVSTLEHRLELSKEKNVSIANENNSLKQKTEKLEQQIHTLEWQCEQLRSVAVSDQTCTNCATAEDRLAKLNTEVKTLKFDYSKLESKYQKLSSEKSSPSISKRDVSVNTVSSLTITRLLAKVTSICQLIFRVTILLRISIPKPLSD